jgi:hypothetical protein
MPEYELPVRTNSEDTLSLESFSSKDTTCPESSNSQTIMSSEAPKTVRVAAVQAEPVWNDLQGGVEKTIGIIGEASKNGANVIGFPEVFIPGYPWYVS